MRHFTQATQPVPELVSVSEVGVPSVLAPLPACISPGTLRPEHSQVFGEQAVVWVE